MIFCKHTDVAVCLERIWCVSEAVPLLSWILQQIGKGFKALPVVIKAN